MSSSGCVLPYSGYMYVEALPSQEQSHLVDGLNRALQFLGGVPLAIKSDNMKQFVKKSCRYEPVFTEVFEQWMAHYNTTLLAARVKKHGTKLRLKTLYKSPTCVCMPQSVMRSSIVSRKLIKHFCDNWRYTTKLTFRRNLTVDMILYGK